MGLKQKVAMSKNRLLRLSRLTILASTLSVSLLAGAAEGEISPRTAGSPSAPTSVFARFDAGTVTIAWSVPMSDGGSPVTSYTATASPGGANCTTTGATTCTITGLAANSSFTFSVVATNGNGDSPASVSSNSVSTVVIPNGGFPPMPQPVDLQPGFTSVTVAGQAVASATTTSMNRSSVVIYTGSTWQVSIGAVAPNGSAVPLNSQGQLTATAGQYLLTTGRGFKANSLVGVYAFPVGSLIATAQANATGNFSALVSFPAFMGSGTHTIQVTGLSSTSQVRVVSLGASVSRAIVGSVSRVYFGLNTYMLTYSEYLRVKQIAAALKVHRGLVVHIDGYSQPTPIDPYPLALSNARALTVKKILGALGVSGTLIATGHASIGANLPSSRVVVISASWTS